ncbi:MAG: pyridoxal-phosphate dependent enzyme, partial [Candidatus Eisenbacteria bacterium]
GAIIHWCGDDVKGEQIPEIAEGLRREGRKVYVIPFGGTNAVGVLGFVAAIAELEEQMTVLKEKIDCLVLPSGSGGTQAGIAVGTDICELSMRTVGIAIDRGDPGNPTFESRLTLLANEVAEKLEVGLKYTEADFTLRYEYFGGGYEVVGNLEREAIRLVAQNEGVLLDPVYTGRAMGGLISMIRNGEFSTGDTVLFWHTGGAPAIFGHARELMVDS